MTGKLITIEGIEGAGKTTIAKRIMEWLESQGMACLHTREPGGTEAGEKIREILLNPQIELTSETELLLFEAARRQIMAEIIMPALESGKTVVLDRFFDSTTAYQGYGRGVEIDWIKRINEFACMGRKPDITLLLDIDVKTGLERARKASAADDRFESESIAFMERVRQGFLSIAQEEPHRWMVVSVDQKMEQIWAQVVDKIKDRLG